MIARILAKSYDSLIDFIDRLLFASKETLFSLSDRFSPLGLLLREGFYRGFYQSFSFEGPKLIRGGNL